MTFAECLEKWEKFERITHDILNKNWIKVLLNPNNKWMDLVIAEKWIEVKIDESSKKYWNFFIEFENNWKQSWIFKQDDIMLEYWAHSDWDVIYLVRWKLLRDFVADTISKCRQNSSLTYKGYRLVEKWWDWWRSKWLLIPVVKFAELATHTFNI